MACLRIFRSARSGAFSARIWLTPFLLLFLPCAVAFANDFRTHYDLALALYQAQRFEEAIPEFQAAYEVEARPGLLFNIAQAYRKAGHPREALQYYERYLTSDPQIDSETRHKVDGYVTEARNTLAALELEMNHRLAEERAARQPEPPPAEPAPPPPPPPSIVLAPPPPPPPPPPPRPIYRRWWFWTGIGAVVTAGVVAGIVVGAERASAPLDVMAGIPRGPLTLH